MEATRQNQWVCQKDFEVLLNDQAHAEEKTLTMEKIKELKALVKKVAIRRKRN